MFEEYCLYIEARQQETGIRLSNGSFVPLSPDYGEVRGFTYYNTMNVLGEDEFRKFIENIGASQNPSPVTMKQFEQDSQWLMETIKVLLDV